MKNIKIAETKFPVNELIATRWSARSFSEKEISEKNMNTMLEAASWAPSAMNEQPWEYVYAHHGTEGFELLKNTLLPGNLPWAKSAAVLIASIARTVYSSNGKENGVALHDLGLANANILLQATALNIHAHVMGGFDPEKLREALNLSAEQKPVCVIALGYLDSPEKLEEPFRSRELQPRTRKALSEFSTRLT
jgi:nitroreductase